MNAFDQSGLGAHAGPMDFRALLSDVMRTAKLNQEGLAERLKVSQSTVSRWLRATDPQEPYFAQYKAVMEIAERYGLVAEQGNSLKVPLISWVSAGELTIPSAVEKIEDARRIDAPNLDPTGSWIALKVEGDSMDKISPPDSIIFVNLRDRNLVANACYVIAGEDGDATYKKYKPDPLPRFEPESRSVRHEPIYPKDGEAIRVIGRVRLSMIEM